MPPAGSHFRRDQFTKDLHATSGKSSSRRSVDTVIGCSVGVLLLLIMSFGIWYKRRLQWKKRSQQTACNGGLDAVTLQKQNENRLRALRSLLPANPNADGENRDWRSKTPSAHPIWREYRRSFEVKLRAEGYSETAIQLASESGYDDSIFLDDLTPQREKRARIPAARIQEYTSQHIQEEIAKQRGPTSASEVTTAGSRTDLSQIASSAISQATSQSASRSRFSQWLIRRVHSCGRNKGLPTLCPPTSPSHTVPNRSGQSIFLSRLSPRTPKPSKMASNPSSSPAERVPRPEEYTANDRIHYMVRVASEEQRRMQQGVSNQQNLSTYRFP